MDKDIARALREIANELKDIKKVLIDIAKRQTAEFGLKFPALCLFDDEDEIEAERGE